MKTMRSCLLALLSSASVSTSALTLAERRPQLTVHEGFLSSGEVDSIVRSIRLDSDSVGTYYGPTVLPRSISERLRDLGGTCGRAGGLHEEGEDEGEGEAVMSMLMTSTTDRHRDCHVPQSEGRVVSRGDVAFVFLGSDPEARFEHGDGDSTAVPVVKGDLVRFRGDFPHRTVVPPGSSVRIAGPFHLPTMEYVGSCPEECVGSDPNSCTGGAFWNKCECFGGAGRALKREGAKNRAMDELRALSLSQGFLRNVAGQPRDLQCDYTCREGTGACCFSDVSCKNDQDVQQCMRPGGKFMGHGTVCIDDNTCPSLGHGYPEWKAETGLCCYSDGRSVQSMRGYCEDILEQYFVPTGEMCPFLGDMGACCMQDKCIYTSEDTCAGNWTGSGAKCENVCEGSCCSADKCEIVTQKGVDDKFSCTSGNFTLGGDCLAGSCPDKCQTTFDEAEVITLPSPGGPITCVSGSTVGKDKPKDDGVEYFEQCEDQPTILPAGSSWYKFNTTVGRLLTITTCSDIAQCAFADHDSSLSLYEGSCDALNCTTEFNSTSKDCSGGSGYTLQFCAKPGTEYKLMVHGHDNLCSHAEGNFTLAVRDDGICTPTASPTQSPTKNPTGSPTQAPTKKPTASPTQSPTTEPTPSPTQTPTKKPTASPTQSPTKKPTQSPTQTPTKKPTQSPTKQPTASPTQTPTMKPTALPTQSPTTKPTASPTQAPTKKPTASPTQSPMAEPTPSPTQTPTKKPTVSPTQSPTTKPTASPTQTPTKKPTASPTQSPMKKPTPSPTQTPTKKPTVSPTQSPTTKPTSSPTQAPTKKPTAPPTQSPTTKPTSSPTESPTNSPTNSPTTTTTTATTTTTTSTTADNGREPATTTESPETTDPGNREPSETTEPPEECECECDEPGGPSWPGKGSSGKGKGKGSTSLGKGKGSTNWQGKGSSGKGSSGKGSSNWPGKGSSGKGSSSWGSGSSSLCGGKGRGKGSTSLGKGKGGTNWQGKGKGGTNWQGKGSSGKGSSGKGSSGKGSSGKGNSSWGGIKSPGSRCVCPGKGKGKGGKGKGGTTWSGKGKGGTTWSGKGKGGTTWSGKGKGGTNWSGKGSSSSDYLGTDHTWYSRRR